MIKGKKLVKAILSLSLCAGFALTAFADEQSYSTSEIYLSSELTYAANSKIHTDPAKLYKNTGANANGITVCVNAGHGTNGGESQRTLCHPDGSPKVTGGSTAEGSTTATAISSGMTFNDGTPEASVTLSEAVILRDLLLEEGYNVLMIRENNDTQLDNVARTVLANNYADCHIAIHWDSSSSDKGAFYCKVPSDPSYKAMEPVASTWQKSDSFGEALITGLRNHGRSIFSSGSMELDLTQTSYSIIPSIDIECGDAASDHSDAALRSIAEGLREGVDLYFENEPSAGSNAKTPEAADDEIIKEELVEERPDGEFDENELNEDEKDTKTEGRVNVTIGRSVITVNGEEYEVDAEPYIQSSSNSTLVPLRFVSIAICGEDVDNADADESISWDNPSRTAYISTDDSVIAFTADSGVMTVNGEKITMPNGAKAEIKNGRMFIPFRALGEALDVEVEWDNPTRTASFMMK